MKYICSRYQGKLYLRCLCCPEEDYSKWETIETDFDAKNKYLNEEGRPVYLVEDGKIRYAPLPKSIAEMQAIQEKEEREAYIESLPELVKELTQRIATLEGAEKEVK